MLNDDDQQRLLIAAIILGGQMAGSSFSTKLSVDLADRLIAEIKATAKEKQETK